ncbi:MAG: Gfo/Idh/MocA family oxidoreductase [Gemmatimonadales bacterium]|nr:Gfo/Idh/MocA family oxidoreductase [Gemmatimonadales bacterium]MBA3709301.1 Gfo/Idh/MocA family oxidoreductase [Planctomycetota bacterium]
MTTPIRWGILGTGNIAHQFARGLAAVPDAVLAAVGSRSQASADAFGDEFKVARRHATYEALAADPGIDVVYVSSPHPMHRDNAKLCLQSGKAVLCEKPFTINAADAEDVVATARAKKRFLMEAMWTRFQPAIVRVKQWLSEGALGEPRLVQADFGFRAGVDPKSRLFAPALGGGALLDVGVYTVAMASLAFGPKPTRIDAQAHLGSTGVDEQTAMVLGYEGGGLALLSCAIRANTPHECRIIGTEGSILIPGFWHATKATLTRGSATETVEMPFAGNGYNYQAVEVGRCLRAGLLESPAMTLDETLAIMRTMDAVRARIGLCYPGETASTASSSSSLTASGKKG